MIIRTPAETKAVARQVAEALQGGENLLLFGDLGSGKTTFTQGLAEGLGIAEQVKSPTYIYLREYEIPLRSTRLAHFDLHRLPDKAAPEQLDSVGVIERIEDDDVITVIEWADRLPRLPQSAHTITFTETPDGGRKIELPAPLRRRVRL